MSKRYGRNQRRKHRERIAELEAYIREVDISKVYDAEGDEPLIDKIISFHTTKSGGADERYRLSTELKIVVEDRRAMEELRDITESYHHVRYQGDRYIISEVTHNEIDFREDYTILGLSLEGITDGLGHVC